VRLDSKAHSALAASAGPTVKHTYTHLIQKDAELIGSDIEARLWYHYYKFHIIEQYIQFLHYLPFHSAVH